jgi:hypothetical protein
VELLCDQDAEHRPAVPEIMTIKTKQAKEQV